MQWCPVAGFLRQLMERKRALRIYRALQCGSPATTATLSKARWRECVSPTDSGLDKTQSAPSPVRINQSIIITLTLCLTLWSVQSAVKQLNKSSTYIYIYSIYTVYRYSSCIGFFHYIHQWLLYCLSVNLAGIIAGSVIGGITLIAIITTIILHSRKQKRCVVAL